MENAGQPSLPIEAKIFDLFLSIDQELRRLRYMKARDFDKQFDENADVTASLDRSNANRVLQEQRRINVDFPRWMIDSLDREAGKLGVTRQSIIKVWLAERLKASASNTTSRPKRRVVAPR